MLKSFTGVCGWGGVDRGRVGDEFGEAELDGLAR